MTLWLCLAVTFWAASVFFVLSAAVAFAKMVVRNLTANHHVCGVLYFGLKQPCILADGHAEPEHATAWLGDGDPERELRYRWTSDDIFGRAEQRYRLRFRPSLVQHGKRQTHE